MLAGLVGTVVHEPLEDTFGNHWSKHLNLGLQAQYSSYYNMSTHQDIRSIELALIFFNSEEKIMPIILF